MPSDRTDFLLRYYGALSDDIGRNEAIIPRLCALQIATVALLVIIRWREPHSYLPNLLVLFTSSWAMHVLINANLSARRSQLMAANVELEFFVHGDLNVLLPQSYYADTQVYRFRRAFRLSLLLSLGLFVLGATEVYPAQTWASLGILVIAALLLGSLYIENRDCKRIYSHLVANAPGRAQSVRRSGESHADLTS